MLHPAQKQFIMKKYLGLILILMMTIQFAAGQNGMPAMRPAGFTLTFHFDGGMMYHFEDIIIAEDSCVYKQNLKGSVLSKRFKLSAVQLDSLYAMLQQNQFTQISYYNKGMVYDRGGERISIGWGNNSKMFTVNDSQSNFVSPEWMSNWNRICRYVKALPAQKG